VTPIFFQEPGFNARCIGGGKKIQKRKKIREGKEKKRGEKVILILYNFLFFIIMPRRRGGGSLQKIELGQQREKEREKGWEGKMETNSLVYALSKVHCILLAKGKRKGTKGK